MNWHKTPGGIEGIAADMPLPDVRPQAVDHRKNLIWEVDILAQGAGGYHLRNPSGMIQGVDYGVGVAPDGSLPVVWMDSHRAMTTGNKWPRGQLQGPNVIAPKGHTDKPWGESSGVFVEYARLWVDAPREPFTTADWLGFFEPHGGPYLTSSAAGLMIVWTPQAGYHLRMGNQVNMLGTAVPFAFNQWVQIARMYRYDTAANGGFIDLWWNLSGDVTKNWQRAKVNGGHRLPLNLIRHDAAGNRTEGGGWLDSPTESGGRWAKTHSKVGPYGSKPMRMYVSDHRVGRSLKDTMPTQWPDQSFGVNPLEGRV